MNFLSFLRESLLAEGGAAIKGSSPITQVEARHLIPDLIDRIASVTGVDRERIKAVGSAGRKLGDTDTSGDIDIAIETTAEVLKKALPELAHDGVTHRSMDTINVYSFGTKVLDKVVQVDLVPVESVEFAAWSFVSDEVDLAKGLKGSQRNELIFAIVKYAENHKVRENGEVVELDRYFFDLSRGLMRGHQTRKNAKGRITKNFTTVSKTLVTDKPAEIAKILFGKHAKPGKLLSFEQVWEAIHAPDFPHRDHLQDIITLAKRGIESKKLKMPEVLA